MKITISPKTKKVLPIALITLLLGALVTLFLTKPDNQIPDLPTTTSTPIPTIQETVEQPMEPFWVENISELEEEIVRKADFQELISTGKIGAIKIQIYKNYVFVSAHPWRTRIDIFDYETGENLFVVNPTKDSCRDFEILNEHYYTICNAMPLEDNETAELRQYDINSKELLHKWEMKHTGNEDLYQYQGQIFVSGFTSSYYLKNEEELIETNIADGADYYVNEDIGLFGLEGASTYNYGRTLIWNDKTKEFVEFHGSELPEVKDEYQRVDPEYGHFAEGKFMTTYQNNKDKFILVSYNQDTSTWVKEREFKDFSEWEKYVDNIPYENNFDERIKFSNDTLYISGTPFPLYQNYRRPPVKINNAYFFVSMDDKNQVKLHIIPEFSNIDKVYIKAEIFPAGKYYPFVKDSIAVEDKNMLISLFNWDCGAGPIDLPNCGKYSLVKWDLTNKDYSKKMLPIKANIYIDSIQIVNNRLILKDYEDKIVYEEKLD